MNKKSVKVISSITITCLMLGVGIWGFVAYKKQDTEKAVEGYLYEEGVKASEIDSVEPFLANLSGDKNYMVAVKLKNDKRTYYYYKNRSKNQVVFESFTLNQKTYSPEELDE